jgi:hypothetical protein
MARVVHFEIHADNPERAAAFYRKVFDWQITKWDGPADYWLITTGPDSEPGINGAIVQRQGPINGDSVFSRSCFIRGSRSSCIPYTARRPRQFDAQISVPQCAGSYRCLLKCLLR